MNRIVALYKRVPVLITAATMLLVSLVPIIINSQQSDAAQLTSRKVTLSTSVAGASATHTFEFNIATTGNIGSMQFLYCTTPLGTCTAPTGLDATSTSLGTNTINGSAAGFTLGAGADAPTANRIRITRTPASATAGQTAVITFSTVTNNTTYNETFYPRITTYSDAAYTTGVDDGVVAGSTARQLTVNARVQERLDFCTGATTINDATTQVASDCSSLTDNGNTIDIGVVDSSLVCVSGPSNPCDGHNSFNGVAMVRTNAFNGVVIDYFAEQETGSGQLKVAGATCADSFTTVTDQCFNSADADSNYANGAQQQTFSAGTERFGMTIAAVNCEVTNAYSCDFSTGNYNLVRDAEYDGDGANTFGTGQGFAWDDRGGGTGTDRIASSAGSAVKVVDDEALILKFAATAGITTPTGQYSVTSTYIATATF